MPRTRLLSLLSAVWAALVLYFFHFGPDPYPPGGLLALAVGTLVICLVAASAWGLGRLLMEPLRLQDESPGEAPFFEIGAGLGALALAVLALAAAGLLYRWAVLAILAGGVALLGRRRPGPWPGTAGGKPWRPVELAMIALTALAGLMTLACSFAPPEFYDALIYHLAVPDQYIRHHGMVPLPHNFYASYPANMGMLYAVGLLLQGGEAAQSIHWLCGALAASLLFAMVARHTDRATAALACALFALGPGVMIVSTWAIADLGVTLFGLLCFASTVNLWVGGGRRWLLAAGIFAGLALGTKYTAAVVVLLPAAAAIALRPGRSLFARATFRSAAADLAIVAGFAALVMSPWLARNLAYAGNPLAPYVTGAGARGEPATPDIAEEIARRLPHDASATGLAAHYLSSPWRVTMQRLGAGGYLGSGLLVLIPMLIFMRGLPRVVVPLAIIAGCAFAGWALTSQVTRYLFPALPPLAALAAVTARRLPRAITVPAIGWGLLYNLFLFLFLVETTGSFRVITGAMTREDYLSRRVSYYPAMAFLETAPPGARVLFVGEGRGYYCPRDYDAGTPFDPPILDQYAAGAGGESGLIERLKAAGFTHLLVSGPELARTRGTTADQLMEDRFPSGSLQRAFEKNDVRIYLLPR